MQLTAISQRFGIQKPAAAVSFSASKKRATGNTAAGNVCDLANLLNRIFPQDADSFVVTPVPARQFEKAHDIMGIQDSITRQLEAEGHSWLVSPDRVQDKQFQKRLKDGTPPDTTAHSASSLYISNVVGKGQKPLYVNIESKTKVYPASEAEKLSVAWLQQRTSLFHRLENGLKALGGHSINRIFYLALGNQRFVIDPRPVSRFKIGEEEYQ